MGKQKRKQAEPEVSNKALKLSKKSKPDTKSAAPKSALRPTQSTAKKAAVPSTKTAKTVSKDGPVQSAPTSKSPGADKSAKKRPPKSGPPPDLPSVSSDAQLKQIAEKAREAEQLAEKQEEEGQGREVVKVKRSQPLLKLKESTAKTYMSISNPAEDDKKVKVPSYSYIKNRGIVYISHVPHGFYEKQMRDFFSQFGVITNLRLGRSRKSGRSRGFAFVEFKYEEVAKVVAETMNNYLMFDKILKVELLSGERKSRAVFMGKIKPTRPPLLKARMRAKALHNADKCDDTDQKRQGRQQKKLNKLQSRLAAAGIDYDIKIAELS